MGIVDRVQHAARALLAGPAQPPSRTTADVVDDPNLLAGSSGRFGDLWYSTSALVNAVSGIGTRGDPSYFNRWATARPLARSELYGMGRNGLIVQALAKLPNTATREGWRVDITDDSVEDKGACSDKIAAYEERLGTGLACARAMVRGRQYSEAFVLLGIDDGQPFSEPVDTSRIRTIRWAAVIDVRYYEPVELYQGNEEGFGKVKRFQITDINGILEDGLRYGSKSLSFTAQQLDVERQRQGGQLYVHADRVLHFPTSDYLSLLETLQDSLGAFFESMNGIRTAARESSTVVYRIKDWVRKTWSENSALAQLHMQLVDRAKSALNAWLVDKDNEDVTISNRSLGGLADLANPFMVWLSAALATPVTVLWGVSPGGFGKGEAERETWHEEVRAYQQNVLAPQLRKIHGYILAAQDGCQLPADTQREILFNDLSPPDEKVRSSLRSEALADIRQLVKDGIISKAEARPGVAALQDDYFRLEVDLKSKDEAAPAQVGIFTGSIQLLQAMYPAGIPIDAGRNLLLAIDPVHFKSENIRGILPDGPEPASTPTLAPDGATESDDGEDEAGAPSEVDLAWSTTPLPPDAEEASVIAKELRVPTVRVTRAHRAGLIEGWNVLGGKPRYSVAEVRRVVLQGNGKLPAPEADSAVTDDTDDTDWLDALWPTRDPFRTEHAARQRDPDDFIASTFRRKRITEGVDIVIGKLKSNPRGGMVVQTYRFDAEKFTPAQARKWLADANAKHHALEEAVPQRDALSEEAKAERIAEAFRKYHATVNMGAAELREWAKTEWSKAASVDRSPIERNLRLLETPRADWTLAHAASALRTVNFVARMRGNEQGAPVEIDGRKGPSKRDISLKNWAFDPSK